MSNRCASLDPTWSHLPTPAPTHTAHAAAASHYYHYCSSSPAWLTSGAAFENEALTSALRASMAPPANAYTASAAAAASSFSCPATPSSSTTTSSASELQLSACSGGGHVDAPAAPAAASTRPARTRALAARGPRAGRVTKQRKPRPSRRPQTTYITADPANFRRMVQETTGLPVVHVPGASASSSSTFHGGAALEAVRNWTPPAPACYVLPTLDTSAFLLDRAAAAAVPAAPEEKSPACGGYATDAAAAAAAGDDGSSAALLELEALVCAAAGEQCGFPTLESWWMI